ncbi:hypothetical protein DPMN_131240 [Dreissena polymorpha]|uniref:Uncharacterized protein n=1 Tax=Dreissena polymorpha TaxID=45954 RepID=A0A9D4H486_DREPO|nr:hypothetical protein DPMN_131240 [Dreissena polymorpha]
MESDGKLVPILHGIPSNDFRRIPYDSAADLQTGCSRISKHRSDSKLEVNWRGKLFQDFKTPQ